MYVCNTNCTQKTTRRVDTVKKTIVRLKDQIIPTNTHQAPFVGYSLFSLCVAHKEGLRPSSGDFKLMMTTNKW
jgi:hypothetical protein